MDKRGVSNYSEFTHSVGATFALTAFALPVSVSNYSEFTHSVGDFLLWETILTNIHCFQLFRIYPFGRV